MACVAGQKHTVLAICSGIYCGHAPPIDAVNGDGTAALPEGTADQRLTDRIRELGFGLLRREEWDLHDTFACTGKEPCTGGGGGGGGVGGRKVSDVGNVIKTDIRPHSKSRFPLRETWCSKWAFQQNFDFYKFVMSPAATLEPQIWSLRTLVFHNDS